MESRNLIWRNMTNLQGKILRRLYWLRSSLVYNNRSMTFCNLRNGFLRLTLARWSIGFVEFFKRRWVSLRRREWKKESWCVKADEINGPLGNVCRPRASKLNLCRERRSITLMNYVYSLQSARRQTMNSSSS